MFGATSTGDLNAVIDQVFRLYQFTKTVRNDGKEDVEVVELSKQQREESEVMTRKYGQDPADDLHGAAGTIFRHIWPVGEDQDWRDVWRGWPLQRTE